MVIDLFDSAMGGIKKGPRGAFRAGLSSLTLYQGACPRVQGNFVWNDIHRRDVRQHVTTAQRFHQGSSPKCRAWAIAAVRACGPLTPSRRYRRIRCVLTVGSFSPSWAAMSAWLAPATRASSTSRSREESPPRKREGDAWAGGATRRAADADRDGPSRTLRRRATLWLDTTNCGSSPGAPLLIHRPSSAPSRTSARTLASETPSSAIAVVADNHASFPYAFIDESRSRSRTTSPITQEYPLMGGTTRRSCYRQSYFRPLPSL